MTDQTPPTGVDLDLALVDRVVKTRRLPDRSADADPRGRPAGSAALECSVGVMAFNEEANIAHAITTIVDQPIGEGVITELIVVASGCTDRTASIVAEIAAGDPRVRLIEQEQREGKASAINAFIDAARSPILLMVSADVVVKSGTVDALLGHFSDPALGMVGGRPIPVNDETTFLGHAVHLLWRLHDRLAQDAPKLGEIVAFRNVVPSIPLDTAVDEISIQALVSQLGYRLAYEPQAVVYNRGPANVADFMRQRRRIYAGHLRVRKQQGYAAPTMSVLRVGRALVGSGSFATPRMALWTLGAAALEATARGLGRFDSVRRQPHHVWETATSTKRHIADGASTERHNNILVFHIVNFHQHRLELGVRSSRQLAERVARRIGQMLGTDATVRTEQDGTIIAFLSGDRGAAERTASQLVQDLDQTRWPVNRRRDDAALVFACGIITFSPAGQLLAQSIASPLSETDFAVLTVS
jgi:hypothetical protein